MKKLSIPVNNNLELEVVYDKCPFDKGVVNFQMNKLSVPSSEMIAYARVCGGMNSLLAKHPFWTAECQVYIPAEGIFLVSKTKNPMLNNPRGMYLARTHNDDFAIENSVVEEIINSAATNAVDARETGVLKLSEEICNSDVYFKYIYDITKDDVGSFLFGRCGGKFQCFLRKNKIEKLAYSFLPFDCSRTKKPVAFPVVLDSSNFNFTIQTSCKLSSEIIYICSISEHSVQKPKSIAEKVLDWFR
ncbi:MAG: hypothetical protein HY363_02200 [Candidatus Aenigmarchaeota archaeon]|nr:hypothetical protein [Candidatus Aenigmarchaeota archaeon]